MTTFAGHCLCGSVRYQAQGTPLGTSLCHCEDCRRASGSPFQGWVFFPRSNVHILSGDLRMHRYDGRERTFCAACGSPISFFDGAYPDIIELTLGTMDDAASLKPDDYNWMADHLPWLVIDPTLPQFTHNGPPPQITRTADTDQSL